jgi:quercetin dioxygenase-like cupin family protein
MTAQALAAVPTDQPIRIGQMEIRYLLDGAARSHMGAFELTIAPEAKVPPPHSHSGNDEYIYVLEGTLRYSVDGDARDLKPGEGMFSPRGSVHAFSNPHGKPARALIVMSPDIGAQYFREAAALFAAGGPPDGAKLAALFSRYGLSVAKP